MTDKSEDSDDFPARVDALEQPLEMIRNCGAGREDR
jgi:hypothetical protein